METKLFEQLIESAKTSRKAFATLKHAVVTCQQYELASQLRDIEKVTFPESEEMKAASIRADQVSTAFRMVGLKGVNAHTCWLISEVFRELAKKGGEFSLDDATKIQAKMQELFVVD